MARKKHWTAEEVDVLVVHMYAGTEMLRLEAMLGRTAGSCSGKLMKLRDDEASFVTFGMKRLRGESDRDYEARKELARDEIKRRRARIREAWSRRRPKTMALYEEPKGSEEEPAQPSTNFEIRFLCNGIVMSSHSVDPVRWAAVADGLKRG